MENATQITKMKYNMAIQNHQKLITLLITRTLLPDLYLHIATCKRKQSEVITADNDLETK